VKLASGVVHFATYDGNGNICGYVDGTSGQYSANYEYGPFGEGIRATGPMAKANPFRFSTKYQDDETELVYYGYRFLNPATGRWLSRDPIEERGDLNLSSFTRNDPVNSFDLLGMETVQVRIRTEIRPPDIEVGTKTIHSVTINEDGSKVAETTFVGLTPIPVPLPGVGTLTASVSGTHPAFTITFSGSAYSMLPKAGGVLIPGLPGLALQNLIIDYAVSVQINFCTRKGNVSGAHDGYPSYIVAVKGKTVYDFQQTILPALLPPMDVSLKVNFSW